MEPIGLQRFHRLVLSAFLKKRIKNISNIFCVFRRGVVGGLASGDGLPPIYHVGWRGDTEKKNRSERKKKKYVEKGKPFFVGR